jgi:hypothetical protein
MPEMAAYEMRRVLVGFSAARVRLKADVWAGLLEAISRVACVFEPHWLSHSAHKLGVLLNGSVLSPDQRTTDAHLAACLQAAAEMDPVSLPHAMSAFSLIPLPLDSPARQALLTELPRGLECLGA